MRRSSLFAFLALSSLTACSYYDTALLKFSEQEPTSAGSGGSSGAASGNGGRGGANQGGAGASGGAAGGGGAGSGGISGSGGDAGAAGVSGGGSAGASGAAAGVSGTAGSAGSAAGAAGVSGSGPLVCNRAVIPSRPNVGASGSGGSASGAAGTSAGAAGASAGAAGKAGSAAGASGSSSAPGGSGAGGSNAGAGGQGASGGASAGGSGAGAGPSGNAGSGGGKSNDLVFAIRSLDFGEKADTTQSLVGFDLDGSCTCFDAPGEICKPAKPRSPLCDGPGGRDNSFPRLLKDLVSFGLAESSTAVAQSLEDGNYTVLLRVMGWNGEPNDAEVSVAFYVSRGAEKKPEWDGNDRWGVVNTSVTDGDIQKPTLLDSAAYVVDGQLVASLPTFDANDQKVFIQLNEKFGISLSGAVMVGKIQGFVGAYRITEATLSGRWRDRDFFNQIAGYSGKLSPEPLCTDNFLYPQVKETFCKYADLPGNIADVTGTCAAMSLAATFAAQQAVLGGITQLPTPPVNNCGAAKNPANDSCSK